MDKSIIHVERHAKNFSILDNAFLQDEDLKFRERGFLAYVLSLPRDWELRIGHLAKCSPDGKWIVTQILKGLQEKGYAYRSPIRGPKGRIFGTRWVIREKKKKVNTTDTPKSPISVKSAPTKDLLYADTKYEPDPGTLSREIEHRGSLRSVKRNTSKGVAFNIDQLSTRYKIDTDHLQKALTWFQDHRWYKADRATHKPECVPPRFRERVLVGLARKLQRDEKHALKNKRRKRRSRLEGFFQA